MFYPPLKSQLIRFLLLISLTVKSLKMVMTRFYALCCFNRSGLVRNTRKFVQVSICVCKTCVVVHTGWTTWFYEWTRWTSGMWPTVRQWRPWRRQGHWSNCTSGGESLRQRRSWRSSSLKDPKVQLYHLTHYCHWTATLLIGILYTKLYTQY